MTDTVEVPVSELEGEALEWAYESYTLLLGFKIAPPEKRSHLLLVCGETVRVPRELVEGK